MKTLWIAAVGLSLAGCTRSEAPSLSEEVVVTRVDLRALVEAVAEVAPKTKVEILAPVAGRIEKIFVEEGSRVRKGQELAQVSSTDRAALLDAARAKGNQESSYWEKEYRPASIFAPVPGEIIQLNVVPGQTVSTQTSLFQLSDRLIFKAQVDETDVGKISTGLLCEVVVDSFPLVKHGTRVGLIRRQSKQVNNVSVYEVELEPDAGSKMEGLRAGMTASAKFIVKEKRGALSIPLVATGGLDKQTLQVEVSTGDKTKETKTVTLGEMYEGQVEVVTGLAEGERIRVVKNRLSDEAEKQSPLFPSRRRR